jgi:hypothetical protein
MEPDAILREVWANREAYAAQFNYDLRAMGQDLQARERLRGERVVSFAPRSPTQTLGGTLVMPNGASAGNSVPNGAGAD